MILTVKPGEPLTLALDKIGLASGLQKGGSLVIKINLAHLPEPGHPRTDPALITGVLKYASKHCATCAIAEAAEGSLSSNLHAIGLGDAVSKYQVKVLDLDSEPFDEVNIDGEIHFLPRCLKSYAVRLAIPAASQRFHMTFSNNVKLFVGAIPRRMYQDGQGGPSRPRVHTNLQRSIVSIYRAVMDYSPFSFYVNGGKAMFDGLGEVDSENTLVGDDAVELDRFILDRFGLTPPEYICELAGDKRH